MEMCGISAPVCCSSLTSRNLPPVAPEATRTIDGPKPAPCPHSCLAVSRQLCRKPEVAVQAASIAGDRKTLKADSFIPLAMAGIFLALMIYFRTIGGYKPLTIEEQHSLSKGNAKGTGES